MRFQLVFHPFPELPYPEPHCKQCVVLLRAPESRARSPSGFPWLWTRQWGHWLTSALFLCRRLLPARPGGSGRPALSHALLQNLRWPLLGRLDQRLFSGRSGQGAVRPKRGAAPTVWQEGPADPPAFGLDGAGAGGDRLPRGVHLGTGLGGSSEFSAIPFPSALPFQANLEPEEDRSGTLCGRE